MLNRSTTRKLTTGQRSPLPGRGHCQTQVDGIPDNLAHRRRASRRAFLDARQVDRALEHVLRLPAPGESLHFIVDGAFEPCDLIPATRRLSDPAIIRRLDITTLGLNSDNVATIAAGMDQGKVGQVSILVSHYFSRADKADYAYLQQEIEGRGGRVHAMRTHAKLILMEMTDGSCFTIEGSGNLRACRSIEQFVMTNDRELLLFHRRWIEGYIASRADGQHSTHRRRCRRGA